MQVFSRLSVNETNMLRFNTNTPENNRQRHLSSIRPFKNNLFTDEKLIFFAVAFLQLIPYFLISFIPSMDGPQHLHNAMVLNQLLAGNEVFQQYYQLNPVLVGYWTGHFLLTLFHAFLPAMLAEKMLVSVYLLGLAFSFRYLVTAINPKPNFLTLLIFPFSYSFYFLMGYYTFSLAFIFVFLTFGYYYRHRALLTLKHAAVLFALISLVFLSHGFVFSFFGLALVVFVGLEVIYDALAGMNRQTLLKVHGKRILILLLVSLPASVMFVLYIRSAIQTDDSLIVGNYDITELVNFMVIMRAFVGYHMKKEAYSNYFYWIAIFLTMQYVVYRFLLSIQEQKKDWKMFGRRFLAPSHRIAWIALMFLVIYFVIPDQISAGDLVNRIAVFFFLFLAVWVASRNIPRRFSMVLMIVVLVFFGLQTHYRMRTLYRLAEFTRDVHTLEQYLTPNSVVYPVRFSSHWVDLHFLNYLGVDKPLINLGNPQCQGHFPIVWNHGQMPGLQIGDLDVTDEYGRNRWRLENQEIKQADYIAVYRYNEFQETDQLQHIKEILHNHYQLIAVSPKGFAAVYGLKANQE